MTFPVSLLSSSGIGSWLAQLLSRRLHFACERLCCAEEATPGPWSLMQRATGNPDGNAKQRSVSMLVVCTKSDEFRSLINWLPCERNFHNTSDRRALIYTWPQVTAMKHSCKFMATIVQLSWQLMGACLQLEMCQTRRHL